MVHLTLLVLLAASSCVTGASTGNLAGCNVKINGPGLERPQPLILRKASGGAQVPQNGFGFHLPNKQGHVIVASQSVVRLACPGGGNHFAALGTRVQHVEATCLRGTTFKIEGREYEYTEMFCDSNPGFEERKSSTSCSKGFLIDVGFQVQSDFFKIMMNCFDATSLNVVWSKFDLVKEIDGGVTIKRPKFFQNTSFYPGVKPSTQYSQVSQTKIISATLGYPTAGTKYINDKTSYLARGHLTAMADFVYGGQQRATFSFINASPQWQTLNNGNWKRLEEDLRKMASARALDLEVYTGTHGVMTLESKQIFLFVDAAKRGQLPVPEVFWKVVYEPRARQGVAFISFNNPHDDVTYEVFNATRLLCKDVSGDINWVNWTRTDRKKGYSYCCDVNSFRHNVTTLPNFLVTGLLR